MFNILIYNICEFCKFSLTVNVNAKNIEKAAKKIFRTNKRYFLELCYVKVYSVNRDEKDTFNLSKWLTRDGKFISKPK